MPESSQSGGSTGKIILLSSAAAAEQAAQRESVLPSERGRGDSRQGRKSSDGWKDGEKAWEGSGDWGAGGWGGSDGKGWYNQSWGRSSWSWASRTHKSCDDQWQQREQTHNARHELARQLARDGKSVREAGSVRGRGSVAWAGEETGASRPHSVDDSSARDCMSRERTYSRDPLEQSDVLLEEAASSQRSPARRHSLGSEPSPKRPVEGDREVPLVGNDKRSFCTPRSPMPGHESDALRRRPPRSQRTEDRRGVRSEPARGSAKEMLEDARKYNRDKRAASAKDGEGRGVESPNSNAKHAVLDRRKHIQDQGAAHTEVIREGVSQAPGSTARISTERARNCKPDQGITQSEDRRGGGLAVSEGVSQRHPEQAKSSRHEVRVSGSDASHELDTAKSLGSCAQRGRREGHSLGAGIEKRFNRLSQGASHEHRKSTDAFVDCHLEASENVRDSGRHCRHEIRSSNANGQEKGDAQKISSSFTQHNGDRQSPLVARQRASEVPPHHDRPFVHNRCEAESLGQGKPQHREGQKSIQRREDNQDAFKKYKDKDNRSHVVLRKQGLDSEIASRHCDSMDRSRAVSRRQDVDSLAPLKSDLKDSKTSWFASGTDAACVPLQRRAVALESDAVQKISEDSELRAVARSVLDSISEDKRAVRSALPRSRRDHPLDNQDISRQGLVDNNSREGVTDVLTRQGRSRTRSPRQTQQPPSRSARGPPEPKPQRLEHVPVPRGDASDDVQMLTGGVDIGAVGDVLAGAYAASAGVSTVAPLALQAPVAAAPVSSEPPGYWVQVRNLNTEAERKPLQWFQKRCGGAESPNAPMKAALLPDNTGGQGHIALLELRNPKVAEEFIAAVDAWKLGIPRMRAQSATPEQQEIVNCRWLLVRSLPDKVKNWISFKKKCDAVSRVHIIKEDDGERFALIELETAGATVDFCARLHKEGLTVSQISEAQKKAMFDAGTAAGDHRSLQVDIQGGASMPEGHTPSRQETPPERPAPRRTRTRSARRNGTRRPRGPERASRRRSPSPMPPPDRRPKSPGRAPRRSSPPPGRRAPRTSGLPPARAPAGEERPRGRSARRPERDRRARSWTLTRPGVG